ncbi:hypothetical protein G6F57_012836 [Rhizopus arrhizus]|uniref:Uncharacterized protein n=1 Tax=Rhizopus oryzae TaxID=64495 RepID=A0A9P7BLM6_RHIOR|nr:hypothetical protein G6F23_012805 [Rhizopus arrhizus]KAG0754610.1 hypothetical protein G6F24_012363 [Rhizopus arrhizus]KAG0773024.1 hypothetical protein G6F22_015233 [Rhizopus arrhizus]KAG0790943.1 hypothetical protein G6F21_005437 [Rhizopus arrhizus]KAG0805917.1 hypothetical protein G6F20_011532 [Rhizopus arrhizus]
MTSQGVCPEPKCMPPHAIGLSDTSNSNSDNSSNAGLIGGLVGGLVGGGALMASVGFLLIRHKRKKNKIPLALRKNIANNHSKRNIPSFRQQEEMIESNRNSKVVSGVIPVAFIPPSSRAQSSILDSDRHTSVSTFASTQNGNFGNNPFQDNHHPHSYLGGASRRTSAESHIEQAHAIVQATQAIRAKPQIMRVNTVKVEDSLSRSSSFKKTLKPEEEDPFDDKNKASASKTTDSVLSSAADGEITIFWNGS